MTPPPVPADWYQDPSVPGMLRYWDGSVWTEHTSPAPGTPSPASQTGEVGTSDRGVYWAVRLGAYLIDGLLVALIGLTLLVGGMFLLVALSSNEGALFGGLSLIVMAVFGPWFYYWLFEGSKHAATPGKMLCGLKVIYVPTGEAPGWGRAAGRVASIMVILYVASPMTFGLAALVNYLWPLWDQKGQTLHDKMASTLVVRKPQS